MRWLVMAGLIFTATMARAQDYFGGFYYQTNGNAITITGSVPFPGPVYVPSNINGVPVTAIAPDGINMDNVTFLDIPGSITNMTSAFENGFDLLTVIIEDGVPAISDGAFDNCPSLVNVSIPDSVASIGTQAFFNCQSLTNIVIPAGVTNLGYEAFCYTFGVTSVYFLGNPPPQNSFVFAGDYQATLFYLPETSGWPFMYDALYTLAWNPQINPGANFGVRSNQFGFDITGTAGLAVTVEASTSPQLPGWSPQTTVVLTNGLYHFRDPVQSGAGASRFYRLAVPR